MSQRIGRAAHDCVRDELPDFMGGSWYKYRDGDYVRCSCGRVWYVIDGSFCHYRRVRGRELHKALRDGRISPDKPHWLDSVGVP